MDSSIIANTLNAFKSLSFFEILGLLSFIFISFKVSNFFMDTVIYQLNEKSANKIHVEMKPNEKLDILVGINLANRLILQ